MYQKEISTVWVSVHRNFKKDWKISVLQCRVTKHALDVYYWTWTIPGVSKWHLWYNCDNLPCWVVIVFCFYFCSYYRLDNILIVSIMFPSYKLLITPHRCLCIIVVLPHFCSTVKNHILENSGLHVSCLLAFIYYYRNRNYQPHIFFQYFANSFL